MKDKRILAAIVLALLLVLLPASGALGQGEGPGASAVLGAGFTYQGELVDGGGRPVSASCDFSFGLWDAASGGTQIGTYSAASAVAVTQGRFTALVNAGGEFGANAFAGQARWLQVAVRCPAGSGSFTTLTPRQELTAAPYSLYAARAPWSGLNDVPDGFADGVDNDTIYSAGTGLSLSGGRFSIEFGGTGSADTIARSDHYHAGAYWQLGGNTETTPEANYLGTTDNAALEIKVNGARALRIEPPSEAPNLIGGYAGNWVTDGVYGATIGGGGAADNGIGYPGQNGVAARFATVAGGVENTASGRGAFVGGGWRNTAAGSHSVVGGGWDNGTTLGGGFATVAGGTDNHATNGYSAVCGGAGNTASGYASFVSGGVANSSSGDYGVIGGGQYNQAQAAYTTIGGGGGPSAGDGNVVAADYATVGGGRSNSASAGYATVGGGAYNAISGPGSTIAGGGGFLNNPLTGSIELYTNTITSTLGTIGGGGFNIVRGHFSTVAGGVSNDAYGLLATVSGGRWNASGFGAAVGGGQLNTASGDWATVGGGLENNASGVITTVGGGWQNNASSQYATVSGGFSNEALAYGATIGGGDSNAASGNWAAVGGGYENSASGQLATVGGGWINAASGQYATVGGGRSNSAGGERATVGGGISNTASGPSATVGGGWTNTASGNAATVPGGAENVAGGGYSFAAGAQAHATHDGSFVWSSATATDSWGTQTFTVRSHGGARFYTAAGTGTGVQLGAGGTSWGSISDRNAKDAFAPVDTARLLEVLARMPVPTWNLKSQSPEVRHIGPVAQDFNGSFAYLFGEVESPIHINNMDAVGISLAASRGLYELSQKQAMEIAGLQAENAALRDQLGDLEARLAALEAGQGVGGSPARMPSGWLLLGGGVLAVGAVVGRRAWGGGR